MKEILHYAIYYANMYNNLATLLLTVIATYIALKQFFETRFHKIEVMFPYSENYGNEVCVPYIYIFNKKNKVEVITEILLKIGAGSILTVKTFDEPILLNAMEMKKINLDKVSFYGFETKIISNMNEIFYNKKIEKNILLNTPQGIVKAKNLQYIPEDLSIKMYFQDDIKPIYLRECLDADGDVINYQTMYIGKIYKNDKEMIKFYVFKNGVIKCAMLDKYFLYDNVNLENLKNIDKTKDYLLNIFKYKNNTNYSLILYEHEYKNQLNMETIEINVVNSKIKFFLIRLCLCIAKKLSSNE